MTRRMECEWGAEIWTAQLLCATKRVVTRVRGTYETRPPKHVFRVHLQRTARDASRDVPLQICPQLSPDMSRPWNSATSVVSFISPFFFQHRDFYSRYLLDASRNRVYPTRFLRADLV